MKHTNPVMYIMCRQYILWYDNKNKSDKDSVDSCCTNSDISLITNWTIKENIDDKHNCTGKIKVTTVKVRLPLALESSKNLCIFGLYDAM